MNKRPDPSSPVSFQDAQRLAASTGAMHRPSDVAKLLNISKRTFWRLLANDEIPRPDIRLGRIIRWRPSTIEKWIDQQSRRSGKRGGL